jgi:hypothetical protein
MARSGPCFRFSRLLFRWLAVDARPGLQGIRGERCNQWLRPVLGMSSLPPECIEFQVEGEHLVPKVRLTRFLKLAG